MNKQGINISRFYRRERQEFKCEIITPMFLGNADQEAELRAAPFKGVLRYWWRVAKGVEYKTAEKLLEMENEIFGSPDEKTGGKSRVTLKVIQNSTMEPQKINFLNPGKIHHPEIKAPINPLGYLAGMGIIKSGVIQHSYFKPKEEFLLQIETSENIRQEVQSALDLFRRFSTIGSRNRNGWGSFMWKGDISTSMLNVIDWKEALCCDYPNSLGKDDVGNLFWRTKSSKDRWEDTMKGLAKIYVSLRAGDRDKETEKLEVNKGFPPDRHLLGYPVTHHSFGKWGKSGRHASALRLFVRKEEKGHRGYVLHLPHLFSQQMWRNDKERQIRIWEQVHSSLDRLCDRASFQEGVK